MRWLTNKRAASGIWLTWAAWWFADGACTFVPACAALQTSAHSGERTMADVLVLMLSGFPSGMYVAGFLGDYVVGTGKVIDGFIGYTLLGLGTVAAGYFQWFVVLPWLWKWWKARRSGPGLES